MTTKIDYKEIDGTYFHKETNIEICNILNKYLHTRNIRLNIYYGDVNTGRQWGDKETGYIGRSTGTIKIPLCVANSRSFGGGGLLDHCIVKIEHANKKNGGIIFDITK